MILTIIIHWGLHHLNIHQAAAARARPRRALRALPRKAAPNEAPVVATRRRGAEIASLFGFYWDQYGLINMDIYIYIWILYDIIYIYYTVHYSRYILDIGGGLLVYIMVFMANITWIWILTGSNGIIYIYIHDHRTITI
jgi:hypothetical protein